MSPTTVLGEAWQMYKSHWRHLLPIALVVYLLLSLFALLLAMLLGWLGAIAAAFVSLAGIFWLQGAMVVAIEDVRDGRADLSIGETLSRVRPRMNTLALAGVLAALAIVIGLLLLIVPGVILFTLWFAIVPAIVLERAGVFESFGRSMALVRGNFGSTLGLVILTILILIAAQIAIAIALFWVPDSIQTFVTSVVSNTLIAPFLALVLTLGYYRLRASAPRAVAGAAPA